MGKTHGRSRQPIPYPFGSGAHGRANPWVGLPGCAMTNRIYIESDWSRILILNMLQDRKVLTVYYYAKYEFQCLHSFCLLHLMLAEFYG